MEWKFAPIFENMPFLLDGLWITVSVSVLAMVFGSVIGLVIALIRMSPFGLLRFLAGFYIDVFRTTPLLVQLVWIFFALPILTGVALTAYVASTIALSLYASAYLAEIFRAGILSIASGQRQAGLALGMTRAQLLWRIVLPQAITRMLPPIGSQSITIVKDSALLSLITLAELFWQAQALGAFTQRVLESLTVVAFMYMAITIPLAFLVNHLHKKYLTD